MKQGVDKSEEAGLLNTEKAIADVQSSPVGARSCVAWRRGAWATCIADVASH